MGLNMCFTWDWIGFMDGYGSSHWNGSCHFLKHKIAGCYMDVQCVSSPQNMVTQCISYLWSISTFCFKVSWLCSNGFSHGNLHVRWIFHIKTSVFQGFSIGFSISAVRTLHRLMPRHGRSRSFRAGSRGRWGLPDPPGEKQWDTWETWGIWHPGNTFWHRFEG